MLGVITGKPLSGYFFFYIFAVDTNLCFISWFVEQEFSSEDFLPALSYVVVQCNIPQLLLETEYMMEMLESSWLSGEGKSLQV